MAEPHHRPPRERSHLQRVPPHDPEVEQALLGAAMIVTEAATNVAELVGEFGAEGAFYARGHGVIAAAIAALVTEDVRPDTGTVGVRLRAEGLLDGVGTDSHRAAAYLVWLQANVPSVGAGDTYAAIIRDLARSRRKLQLASDVVEAVYARADVGGLVGELQRLVEESAAGLVSSWEPVNLAAVLAGAVDEAVPSILLRTDGQPLLYPGRVHAFNAEPESAKSFLALWACLEVIARGGHALYVDFEDDAATAVDRLLALGADVDEILERFHYVRPEDPVDVGATARVRSALAAWPIELCVVDGVGEGMSLSGWDENDAADTYAFLNALPRVMARSGAAVVIIDHVVKDPDKRGGYAIGSNAKKRAGDVALELQVVEPFGRDRDGIVKVWVRKDRHGHLRGKAVQGRLIAEMHISSRDGGTSVFVELRPPAGPTTPSSFRPTELMARVSLAVIQAGSPPSKRTLRALVSGKNSYKDVAISLLEMEGYIKYQGKGYISIRPFTVVDAATERQESFRSEEVDDDF